VNVLNLCSNIKLTLSAYFDNGAVSSKLSDQQIDIGTKMNASFDVNATQDDFECALLCKLQRHSDNQYSTDIFTTGTNESNATHVYILAAWKVKGSESFKRVVLVEHTNEFTWDEDKLKKLYYKNHGWLEKYNDTITDTWFMDDNMILKTTLRVRGMRGSFELSISIYKEEKNEYAIRPLCVDLER
jgi:hypothetical protein